METQNVGISIEWPLSLTFGHSVANKKHLFLIRYVMKTFPPTKFSTASRPATTNAQKWQSTLPDLASAKKSEKAPIIISFWTIYFTQRHPFIYRMAPEPDILTIPCSVPMAWLGLAWHGFTGFKLILASKSSQVTSQPIKPRLTSQLGKCVI